ncbi:MAG: Gfo/Idh/MocA family protein [Tepidisphaerales bacterium]
MNGPTNFSRRRLMKAAVAAAAFPYIVPGSALGADGQVPPSQRVAMGFIGIGGQGGGHLFGGAWTYIPGGYLAREEVQIVGTCDIRRDVRENAMKRVNEHYSKKSNAGTYKSCQAYTDFRELIARDDVDAVLIGTPIHWHSLMTVMAAKAGKDVYCEKPTSMTVAEAQAARDAVRRYGRVFQAGTQQRSEYGGKFRMACELIRSGRIGQLKTVYSHIEGGGPVWRRWFGGEKPVPAGFDWDLFLGPAPWSPFQGVAHAHLFGTDPVNWGQHHWDIVQWGIGADDTGPVEVSREKVKYANGVEVICGPYPDRTIGLGAGVNFPGEGGCVFVGTEGKIAVDRQVLLTNPVDILRKPLKPDDVHLDAPGGSHSGNFLHCVRTRGRTICNIDSSYRAAILMLLPDIARRLGRTLKWDPQKEQFVGDAEANRLLSLPYRAPWKLG